MVKSNKKKLTRGTRGIPSVSNLSHQAGEVGSSSNVPMGRGTRVRQVVDDGGADSIQSCQNNPCSSLPVNAPGHFPISAHVSVRTAHKPADLQKYAADAPLDGSVAAGALSVTDALCNFALAHARNDTADSSAKSCVNGHTSFSSVVNGGGALDSTSTAKTSVEVKANPTSVLTSSVVSTDAKIPFLSEPTDEAADTKIQDAQNAENNRTTSVSSVSQQIANADVFTSAVVDSSLPLISQPNQLSFLNPTLESVVCAPCSITDDVLAGHWRAVQQDALDFSAWTRLLQHVEAGGDLREVRRAYNAFLPGFPCCFAYWKKYAELEYQLGNWTRAFAVLDCGLSVLPLSVDLWRVYLDMYDDHAHRHQLCLKRVSVVYERAANTAGRQFESDSLWERIMSWAAAKTDPSYVFRLYRQAVCTPTRHCDKHWDACLAHVTKHNPHCLVSYDEYCEIRRRCCAQLGVEYREEPLLKGIKGSKDFALVEAMREDIVEQLRPLHARAKLKVDRVLKMEDKLKRPYFHVVPLDKRQLRTWREYVEFETKHGRLSDVVLVYERCLVACAQYEDYWMMYAAFLERQLEIKRSAPVKTEAAAAPVVKLERTDSTDDSSNGGGAVCPASEPSRSESAGECVTSTEQPADSSPAPTAQATSDGQAPCKMETDADNNAAADGKDSVKDEPSSSPTATTTTADDIGDEDLADLPRQQWPVQLDISMHTLSVHTVRNVYRRACTVHCRRKPNIRLQWASFEEEHGSVDDARVLVTHVCDGWPTAVSARLQLIGLERRAGNLTRCVQLYDTAVQASQEQPALRTWWAMKQARFHFKILHKPDRALAVLRSALKRDRANTRLFNHILDICYQRNPVDIKGVGAVLTLAIGNKDIAPADRLAFLRKRVEFYEEFGSVQQLRAASVSLAVFDKQLQRDQKRAAKEGQPSSTKSLDADGKPSVDAHLSAATSDDGNPTSGKRKRKAGDAAVTAGETSLSVCPGCRLNLKDPVAVGLARNMAAGMVMSAPMGQPPMSMPPSMPPPPVMAPNMMPPPPPMFFPAPPSTGNANWQSQPACFNPVTAFPAPFPPNMSLPPGQMGPMAGDLAATNAPVSAGPSDITAVTASVAESLPPPPQQQQQPPLAVATNMAAAIAMSGSAGPMSGNNNAMPNGGGRSAVGPVFTSHTPPPQQQHMVVNSQNCVPGGGGGVAMPFCAAQPPFMQQQQQQPMSGPTLCPPWSNAARTLAPPQQQVGQLCGAASSSMSSWLNVPGWFVERGGSLCISETSGGRAVLHYSPRFLSEKGYTRMLDSLVTVVNWQPRCPSASKAVCGAGGDVLSSAIERYVAWFSHAAAPLAESDHAACIGHSSMTQDVGDQEMLADDDGATVRGAEGFYAEWPPELSDLLGRLSAFTGLQLNSCALTLFRGGRDFSTWRHRSSDADATLTHTAAVVVSLGAVRPLELQSRQTSVSAGGDCAASGGNAAEGYMRLLLPTGSVLVLDGSAMTDWAQRVPVDRSCQGEHISLVFTNMRED